MIRVNDDGFFEVFPAVKTITEAFEYQNGMLNKIVLTGKINALEIAENLFEFTEQTADTFAILQEKIIENLLTENKKAIEIKANLKLKAILAILAKDLYQLSNNVNLLSQNEYIIDFLKGDLSKVDIKGLLEKYKNSYSIYNEVLIIDKNRKIRANINPKNRALSTQDNIINEAFESEKCIQAYKKTDMLIFQRESLFLAKRVVDKDGNILGVVVVSLDLKNEMPTIFKNILDKNETFSVVNKFGDIVASSEVGMDKKALKNVNKLDSAVIANNRFNLKSKIKSYKDNSLFDWYGIISLKREADINVLDSDDDKNKDSNIKQLIQIQVKNPELKKITGDAYGILEDLSDVIINGELIAAKSKQYILIPILDNLREVSFRVVKLIEISIASLQKIIADSIENDIKSVAKFSIFSIFKVMYEISNDVRWWALNKTFVEELSSQTLDISAIKEKLVTINTLYSNYYNIFVYDNSGKIIASTKEGEGLDIENKMTSVSNGYSVSEFKPSKFYNNKPTYIFYAPITKNGKVLGGIGVVLDIDEFNEILKEIFAIQGFVMLVNKKREVIASTTSKDIIEDLSTIELKDGIFQDISIDGVNHKVTVAHMTKYREYENEDLFIISAIEN